MRSHAVKRSAGANPGQAPTQNIVKS